MNTLRILFSLGLTLALISSHPLHAADAKKEPPALLNEKDLPAKYREAAGKVAAVLASEKEEPREFKAEVEEQEAGRVFVFHLWHKSAFEPQNKGVVGNPGGRCRDVLYDTKTKKASHSLFWQ